MLLDSLTIFNVAAGALLGATPGGAGEPSAAVGAIGLQHYLVVGALTFALGTTIIIVRRNAIAVLMGIELIINSAGLNFAAFSKFAPKDSHGHALTNLVEGQVLTIFVIVLAAAEAALALAIILNIYNNMNTVEVDEADSLSG